MTMSSENLTLPIINFHHVSLPSVVNPNEINFIIPRVLFYELVCENPFSA